MKTLLHRNSYALAFTLLAALAVAGCSKNASQQGAFIDPGLAVLVPPDTTLLAGVRVDQLVKNANFDRILQNRVIQDVAKRGNIDPKKALWQVLFVSNGKSGVVLARGKFADELMAPDFTRQGTDRFGYKGLTMFGNEQEALLFVNSSTIAIGETADLRGIVDRRQTTQGPPSRFEPLLQQIPRAALFWGAYAGGEVELPLSGNMANIENLLTMVSSGIFFADFDQKMHLTASLNAPSPDRATQLHDTLQGLMALAQIPGNATTEGAQVKLKADLNY